MCRGRLFEPLADADVNVDMIVQNVSIEGVTDISFTVPKSHLDVARRIAERDATAGTWAPWASTIDENIAKVSLVGAGMKSELGIAGRMFRILSDRQASTSR